MKRWFTTMAVVAALALPMNASAGGGGYYDWYLSFSNSTPDEPTGPDPSGILTIYLWFVNGCNPGGAGPGMSAADFKVNPSGASPWTVLAFNTANGFLNAGSATDLLLAVGGCPTGPVIAGSFLVNTSGAGGLWLGVSNTGNAATVNCESNPDLFQWPGLVRFRGCQSVGSSFPLQDHGAGCPDVVSVEDASWGSIKSLYR